MPYKDPERRRAYDRERKAWEWATDHNGRRAKHREHQRAWRERHPLRVLLDQRKTQRRNLAAQRAKIEQELNHG